MATLIDAVRAFNKSPKDPAARQALAAIVGSKAAFKPEQKPDAADVEKALDFLTDLGEDRAPAGRYRDYQTLDEYLGAGRKRLEADPSVDGVALDPDGISMDPAEVDWSKVPADRRLWVLIGRDTGKISRTPDPDTRRRWAEELARPMPPASWSSSMKALSELKASQREALEERLTFRKDVIVTIQKQDLNAEIWSPPVPEARESCAADGRMACPGYRGPCALPGERGHCGRRIPGEVTIPADAASVRRALDATFRTDSDFEAFVLDCFPEAHKRFGHGQNRTAKTTLLIQYVEPSKIGIALSRRQ